MAYAPSIADALITRCRAIEAEIALRVAQERDSAIDSFDSGLPVEDIVREALAGILPTRYSVSSGTVVDSKGSTAGDADVVVFNSQWFPEVRPPATAVTRRRLLPVEGIYAVGEVKQTLTFRSLDAALEKLVRCHRLVRASVPRDRLTENRDLEACPHGLSNPLYSFVVATSAGDELQALVERFFDINRSLSPLYSRIENLMLHLYHSVLGPEDIVSRYGPLNRGVRLPADPKIALATEDG